MFLDIAQRPEIDGIYHSCVRAIDSARRQIYGYLCEDEDCRRVFLKILSNPDSLRFALPQMHVHGVLSKYLQQWEKIVGQMQFDMFHFYTVDEHTIMALQNIWYFTHDDRKRRSSSSSTTSTTACRSPCSSPSLRSSMTSRRGAAAITPCSARRGAELLPHARA